MQSQITQFPNTFIVFSVRGMPGIGDMEIVYIWPYLFIGDFE